MCRHYLRPPNSKGAIPPTQCVQHPSPAELQPPKHPPEPLPPTTSGAPGKGRPTSDVTEDSEEEETLTPERHLPRPNVSTDNYVHPQPRICTPARSATRDSRGDSPNYLNRQSPISTNTNLHRAPACQRGARQRATTTKQLSHLPRSPSTTLPSQPLTHTPPQLPTLPKHQSYLFSKPATTNPTPPPTSEIQSAASCHPAPPFAT